MMNIDININKDIDSLKICVFGFLSIAPGRVSAGHPTQTQKTKTHIIQR